MFKYSNSRYYFTANILKEQNGSRKGLSPQTGSDVTILGLAATRGQHQALKTWLTPIK